MYTYENKYSIYTYLLTWIYSLCHCPSFPLTLWCSICVLLFLSFFLSFFIYFFFSFFLSFFLLSFFPSFLRSFFLSFSLCQRVNRHMLAFTPKLLTQTRISIHSSMDRHLGASNLHAHVHACARSLCTKAAVYQVRACVSVFEHHIHFLSPGSEFRTNLTWNCQVGTPAT